MTNSTRDAPDFTLSRLDGMPWEYPLDAAGRPMLLVFFEIDCPTCLLTLPYLNRLDETVGDAATVLGIFQNIAQQTNQIIRQLEIRFTVLLAE